MHTEDNECQAVSVQNYNTLFAVFMHAGGEVLRCLR